MSSKLVPPSFSTEILEAFQQEIKGQIKGAKTLEDCESLRYKTFGKRSQLREWFQEIKGLTEQDKHRYGQLLNCIRQSLVSALKEKTVALQEKVLEEKLVKEQIDLSLPARHGLKGSLHPLTQVTEMLFVSFEKLGFTLAEGPEIEDDYHNFSALNFSPFHPAREEMDTFYVRQKGASVQWKLLRTHTSPVQIRWMKTHVPPHRIVACGRAFRSDTDQTHTPMFHQIEGLIVEDGIHMGHLKHTLLTVLKDFFQVESLSLRFRPSFFPFTTPSAEVDVGYSLHEGCLTIGGCEHWMEVLGCGMVHPRVLEAVGLGNGSYQGMAFGMGLDRLALLKGGIEDLRTLFQGDSRWCEQAGFSPLDIPALSAYWRSL